VDSLFGFFFVGLFLCFLYDETSKLAFQNFRMHQSGFIFMQCFRYTVLGRAGVGIEALVFIGLSHGWIGDNTREVVLSPSI
jgi:hypothetical protein